MSKATTPKKAAKKAIKKLADEPKEICFVIMPFGSYFDSYYEQIYKPAIEKAGYISRRADDLYRPSAIINDIWRLTKKAKIILADLSTKNPNVFYELGLAHAIKKPAIILTQTMDDVPFDLRGLRVIPYDRMEVNWAEILKFKIIRSIKEIEESPTLSIPPTFLEEEDSVKKEITISEKDFLQLRNDIERLKNSSYAYIEDDSLEFTPFITQTANELVQEFADLTKFTGIQIFDNGQRMSELISYIRNHQKFKKLSPDAQDLLIRFIRYIAGG